MRSSSEDICRRQCTQNAWMPLKTGAGQVSWLFLHPGKPLLPTGSLMRQKVPVFSPERSPRVSSRTGIQLLSLPECQVLIGEAGAYRDNECLLSNPLSLPSNLSLSNSIALDNQ